MLLVLRVVSIYVKCTLHDLESTCHNVFFHLLRKYHHNEFHDRECYYQICSVLDSNGVAM